MIQRDPRTITSRYVLIKLTQPSSSHNRRSQVLQPTNFIESGQCAFQTTQNHPFIIWNHITKQPASPRNFIRLTLQPITSKDKRLCIYQVT